MCQQPRQFMSASECGCACSSCRKESRLGCVFLQVYGASLKDPANACLVMELVKGGNLHQRIYDRSSPRLTHLEILQVSLLFKRSAFQLVGKKYSRRSRVFGLQCTP